jgi:protein required for attachment to host cells
MITWILICDSSRARLFSTQKRDEPWKLLRELDHPASRQNSTDFPAGTRKSDTGGSYPNSYQPPTMPKEVEAEHFVRELGEALEEGRVQNQFERLVLVAPPQFLGLLRAQLSAPALKMVVATLDKDLTRHEARELPERLADLPFEQPGA